MSALKTPIPEALVRELEQRFPKRCLNPSQNVNEALFYGGKVEMVVFLRQSYEDQQKRFLEGS